MKLLTDDEIPRLVDENLDRVLTMDDVKGLFTLEETDTPKTYTVTGSKKMPALVGSTFYEGKVRANFFGPKLETADEIPIRGLGTTDMLSSHDTLRGYITFKGEILNAISNMMFDVMTGNIENTQLATPGPNVVLAEQCDMVDFEFVMRAYLAKSTTKTSLYYHYFDLGKREFCGHQLPEGLQPYQRLPHWLDTPSTKDRAGGNDVSVPAQHLFDEGITTPDEYYKFILPFGMADFAAASIFYAARNLILADDKREIGRRKNGRLGYVDEVFTPDAIRAWEKDDYKAAMQEGRAPQSFSKQYGRDIGTPGVLFTDDERRAVAIRLVQTFQKYTQQRFEPDQRHPVDRFIEDMNAGFGQLM